ncbi:MAG: hypothetical protein ACK4SY_01950 [Pyrobaculum sp.]
MNRYVLIGALLVVVAVAVVVLLAFQNQPAPLAAQPSVGKMYVYTVRIGDQQVGTAYFIALKEGVVYGDVRNESLTYILFRESHINVLARGPRGEIQKSTYYSKPLGLCINSTTSLTIAGEQVTLSNSQCRTSYTPLPTARSFEDAVFLVVGLPPPASWTRAGVAQTPFGQAVVYVNTTTVPIFPGLNAVLNYEKQQLPDGAVYMLKVQLTYGTQPAATLTYVLQKAAEMAPEVRQAVAELMQNVTAAVGGGLDVLRVAEKIGMSYDGGWPAAVIFFDLDCPYCAQLFRYNYTLFQGHKVVLIDLVVHEAALPDHQRLRCLYQKSPQSVVPTLLEIYARFLAGDRNYTDILPTESCTVDVQSSRRLAEILAGQAGESVGTPMVAVIYPNGTYTVIVGYNPAAISKALRG